MPAQAFPSRTSRVGLSNMVLRNMEHVEQTSLTCRTLDIFLEIFVYVPRGHPARDATRPRSVGGDAGQLSAARIRAPRSGERSGPRLAADGRGRGRGRGRSSALHGRIAHGHASGAPILLLRSNPSSTQRAGGGARRARRRGGWAMMTLNVLLVLHGASSWFLLHVRASSD